MSDPLEERLARLALRPPSPELDHRVGRSAGTPGGTLEERIASLPLREPSRALDRRVTTIRPRRSVLRLALAAAACLVLALGATWAARRLAADGARQAREEKRTAEITAPTLPAESAVTPDVWVGYPQRNETIHDLGYQREGDAVLHRLHGLEVESYHLIDATSGRRIRVDIPVCREYRRRLDIY